ncbi:heterokaryon incompatibility protein [Alternaria sp. MG1]|nr:heterokaryon incompatibility protein [Alternaria sp. MG1]
MPREELPVATGVYRRNLTIPVTQSIEAALEWMNSCLHKHEQCQKHTQPHTYPTRLLELGGHNFRLILSQDEKPSGPYAALSYCWGPNPSFPCLTADNLQDFQDGRPYTSLPIAFQEAIHILEKLSIQYVWIDALCIIQSGVGSGKDWQFECGRMEEVYSNCIINLSLAQAAHPNESCLRGYTLDSTLPFRIDVVDETHHDGSYTVLSRDYFTEALNDQPLGSRAWVLQERLLATRVLSIGNGELFWDCEQLPHASESLPYGFTHCSDKAKFFRNHLSLPIPSLPRIKDSEDMEGNRSTSDSADLEDIWSRIIKEYNARQLTYPQIDKLVALSAISRRMSYAMDDEYLAGHFRKTLPLSLNWYTDRSNSHISRPTDRPPKRLPRSSNQICDGDWINNPSWNWVVTPSWSWASVDGRLVTVATCGDDMKSLAAMEMYEFSPVGRTGQKARLEHELLLTIRTWCWIIEWSNVQMDTDYGLIRFIKRGLHDLSFHMDDMNDIPDDESQCLLAALIHSYDTGFQVIEGLILREIDFDGKKVYGRMGHFAWYFHVMDEDVEEDVREHLETYFPHGERSITLC